MRRSSLLVVAFALTLVATGLTPRTTAKRPVSVAPPSQGSFTCRASLLRTEGFPIPLLNQEPVIANAQNDPCVGDNAALLDPLNPLTVGNVAQVRALYAQTKADARSSEALSGAADAVITIPGAPTVRASASTSQATATCGIGAAPPTLQGSSNVLFVQIGEEAPLVDVSEQQTIPLPGGGQVVLNQQQTTANEITQRALRVEVPGIGTVTVAESRADFHGNPCAAGGGGGGGGGGGANEPPECSDERDNDGDGFIDYPNDPGCESPQDDDETDNEPPQCSDGVDNDGDGRTDYPDDPGCGDRSDDDESDDGPAECSDGVDNDSDGTIDFGADSGCKSPEDDDEAAGFMTGGGGYDEADKKTAAEDVADPGSSLRFGGVYPCDVGETPGPNLTVSWHDPKFIQQFKLDTQSRAFCRNDPFVSAGRPRAEFDTYVGEGTGRVRLGSGIDMPVTVKWISIDRGEPGSPPVIGVDFFEVQVIAVGVVVARGVGTLDHGNLQAHTPG